MALVFLLYALFASVFTVAKGALAYTAPVFLIGGRMATAGVLMLGYAALKCPHALRLSRRAFARVALLGIFNIYLTNVLEFWGLQYLTSFKTCFIYSLSPFLSALFSFFLLQDVLSLKKWAGLMIGFLGFTPILLHHGKQESISGLFAGFSWAEISVVGAVIFSVVGWILLKQLVQKEHCPPVVANGYSMLLGGLLALSHSIAQEPWNPIPVTSLSVWLESTLFLIVVSNIICYNLYGFLLKRFSPTFMAFAGLTTPLSTAIFGWVFHGEAVSSWFFLSLSIVFIGLLIFYYEEIKSTEFFAESSSRHQTPLIAEATSACTPQ